ncbi:MAG: tyrosine-type recombinase/integrase [Armatimonadetes bacterium]|nr:tyrosine-type recombinase/integrase [Armatimonadota bacterium]
MAYQCGLRVSEAVKIKIADIDGELKTITIRNSKGNKDRAIPLPANLYFQLREYWKTHRNIRLLFPKRKSKSKKFDRKNTTEHIPIRTAQQVMNLATKDAGILKKATFHTLRHSYATHLLEAGLNIKTIQQFLGHSNLRSTIIYLHLTNASEKRSVEILNELMEDF